MNRIPLIQKTITFVVALFLTAGMALAKDDKPGKEMRKEMRRYVKTHIKPVLSKQRSKLENQLSPQDRAEIEKLRTQLRELHEQKTALRKQFRESGGERPDMEPFREKTKMLMQSAKAIADRYQKEIDGLLGEISADRSRWKTDLTAIRDKYAEELKQLEKNRAKSGKTGKHGKHGGKMERLVEMKGAAFLLWDHKREAEERGDKQKESIENKASNVYPNPAETENHVAFQVAKQGTVNITLIDEQGNVIKTLLNEPRSKGSHELKADLSGLKSGVYYYRITTETGTETKKFIIK